MPEIKMISNSDRNHLDELKALFNTKADRLIIVSPFLATNIRELLGEFSFEKTGSIELVTTLKPKDPEQLSKPYQLKDYFEFFHEKHPKIKVKLHVDNDLHGKIFVATHEAKHLAILGSANFTRNGLCKNHEWGILIENNNVIDNIIEDVFDSIEYREVTYDQIKRACGFADTYGKDHPEWKKKPDIYSDILNNVYSVENSSNTEPKYFLKPIGDSDFPVLLQDKEDFSDLHQNLHFSKKKPKGVRKGDIVITVAVGGGALISFFKVTGGLQHVTNEEIIAEPGIERWPWYMEGRNQSPEFAKQWWAHNIQRKDALNEF